MRRCGAEIVDIDHGEVQNLRGELGRFDSPRKIYYFFSTRGLTVLTERVITYIVRKRYISDYERKAIRWNKFGWIRRSQ